MCNFTFLAYKCGHNSADYYITQCNEPLLIDRCSTLEPAIEYFAVNVVCDKCRAVHQAKELYHNVFALEERELTKREMESAVKNAMETFGREYEPPEGEDGSISSGSLILHARLGWQPVGPTSKVRISNSRPAFRRSTGTWYSLTTPDVNGKRGPILRPEPIRCKAIKQTSESESQEHSPFTQKIIAPMPLRLVQKDEKNAPGIPTRIIIGPSTSTTQVSLICAERSHSSIANTDFQDFLREARERHKERQSYAIFIKMMDELFPNPNHPVKVQNKTLKDRVWSVWNNVKKAGKKIMWFKGKKSEREEPPARSPRHIRVSLLPSRGEEDDSSAWPAEPV